jgi:nitroimidazol reductase NimA-like FMN-containing flavoprotein (pyridoxamine 5'-phosphate oxidase superfamily)
MDGLDPDDLTADERSELLGTGGVGVLAFDTDAGAPPHAIPVSYGFDPVEEVFYFRLSVGPESAKGDVANRAVTFVVHGADDEYWSVVAQGRIVSTDEADVSSESLAGLDRSNIPIVDAFDAPVDELTFEFVRLDPDELTGLRTA